MIKLGIKKLIDSPPAWFNGRRLGLLCNQASVDENFVHSRRLIEQNFPAQLTCLFSPQHGFFAEKQDNMIESNHRLGQDIPIFSLYGRSRRPAADMLDLLDVLLIDLPDAGTRVYTFMSTMAYCLEEAAIHHKRVVVLDRPNPVGGDLMEGNVLEDDCRSFVGLYDLPMRHGMTLGELALFINSRLPQAAELTIIPMEGWRRRFFYPETGLPWVYPSPNLPNFTSALVYPGQVIWEGTNISEGRGTTLPFELWGAPFIRHERIMAALTADDLPGCLLRPVFFEPTAGKWAAETCAGFQIHVTNRFDFRPYHVSLALLRAVMMTCGDNFKFKKPPYEYEFERLPLDLILGSKPLRRGLAAGRLLTELETEWQPGLNRFKEKRQEFLLYN
ncbi:Protein YzbB [hydrothermal vent metagenome]|uniref:Protein YzbB n=1 Tax=hydrothermal vent metagenome TaxID=652676 RepID=A0A3B0VJG6_9ZZZZ